MSFCFQTELMVVKSPFKSDVPTPNLPTLKTNVAPTKNQQSLPQN